MSKSVKEFLNHISLKGIYANNSLGESSQVLQTDGDNVYWGDAQSGSTGPQGSIGFTGSRGSTGSIGFTGSRGSDGVIGPQGSIGFTGSRGSTGSIGFTGSRGSDGVIGPQGSTGAIGPQGSTGFTGSRGATGSAGSAGPQGSTGFTGSRGATGSAGSAGPQGSIGFTGSRGSPDDGDDILSKLINVDGAGSGLDADLLGGIESNNYVKKVEQEIINSFIPFGSALMEGNVLFRNGGSFGVNSGAQYYQKIKSGWEISVRIVDPQLRFYLCGLTDYKTGVDNVDLPDHFLLFTANTNGSITIGGAHFTAPSLSAAQGDLLTWGYTRTEYYVKINGLEVYRISTELFGVRPEEGLDLIPTVIAFTTGDRRISDLYVDSMNSSYFSDMVGSSAPVVSSDRQLELIPLGSNPENNIIRGNSVMFNSNAGGSNGVRSKNQAVGSCKLSFSIPKDVGSLYVGLTDTTTTNTRVDIYLSLWITGVNLSVRNKGSFISGVGHSHSPGDNYILTYSYESGKWSLYVNTSSTPIASGTLDRHKTLFFSAAATSSSTIVEDIVFEQAALIDDLNFGYSINNDGSGSGLDADLLDGLHSSSFLRSDLTTQTPTFSSITSLTGSVLFGTNSGWGFRSNITTSASLQLRNSANALFASFYADENEVKGIANSNGTWRLLMPGLTGPLLRDGTHTVWDAGNDGAGSGLDADLWDGNQFSSFLNQPLTTVNSPVFTNLFIRGNNLGRINLISGTATRTGYIEFRALNNTRHGYIGFSDSTGTSIPIQAENGYHYSFNVTPKVNSSDIYHAGNDGAGSGLDADLLDGLHASSFVRTDTEANLSSLTFPNSIQRKITFHSTNYDMGIQSGALYSRVASSAQFLWYKGGIHHPSAGNAGAGGSEAMRLDANNNLSVQGSITAAGNTVYHAGNDGSGSGLDADLLDGLHATSFVRTDASSTIPTGTLSFGATTRQMLNLWSTTYGFGIQWSTLYFRSAHTFSWHRGGTHSGEQNNPGSGGIEAMRLDANSNLSVVGGISAYASDSRLKKNKEVIKNSLSKLKKIRGYEFDWDLELTSSIGFTPNNEHEHGLLAQEIQEVVPDAVVPSASSSEYLTAKYERIIPLLVESIHELNNKIEELESRLAK